jgi:ribosome maturation factor RimP
MTDTSYKSTITEITVHDDPRNCLTDFEATVIKLADEGGGAYITIIQGENEIRLDLDELPLVSQAVDRLLMQHKAKESPKQEQSDGKHVLAAGQRWRRADGKEVEVFSRGFLPGNNRPAYRVGPVSPVDGGSWWYLSDGTCNGLKGDRPDLALVELLQP